MTAVVRSLVCRWEEERLVITIERNLVVIKVLLLIMGMQL
jgi:hypothetical protein